jgi:hypothetical protein
MMFLVACMECVKHLWHKLRARLGAWRAAFAVQPPRRYVARLQGRPTDAVVVVDRVKTAVLKMLDAPEPHDTPGLSPRRPRQLRVEFRWPPVYTANAVERIREALAPIGVRYGCKLTVSLDTSPVSTAWHPPVGLLIRADWR